MTNAVLQYDKDALTDCFLVERMANAPLAELIVGIRCDPQFGRAITIGSGGILAELVGDVKTLLLPTSIETIRCSIEDLKVAKLLNGYRGRPKADIDTLCTTLFRLTEFVVQASQELAEVEINPMFIYENDSVAVDALIHVGE
jgi:succinyl-CoA synthetase beta subunit